MLKELSLWYGTGADDPFNDGFEMVAWRDFVDDVKAANECANRVESVWKACGKRLEVSGSILKYVEVLRS